MKTGHGSGNPSARWKERSSCRGERQRSSTRFDLGRAIKTVETEQKGGWIALRSTELLGCTGSFCSFFLFAFFAFGPRRCLRCCSAAALGPQRAVSGVALQSHHLVWPLLLLPALLPRWTRASASSHLRRPCPRCPRWQPQPQLARCLALLLALLALLGGLARVSLRACQGC